ncbi:MAG: sulfate adenylyltransferase [Deltaproteobacteria bacterium]|nr:sulfate adenylyltransferase [Deltaproteobacteria bacterium]
MKFPLPPHGGELIDRVLVGRERDEAVKRASSLARITLNDRELSDLDMIACGALSPLTGFMHLKDYKSVLDTMHLVSGPATGGLPWTIPITLAVKKENAGKYKEGEDVALYDPAGTPVAILHLKEKFTYNKEEEAAKVYKTTDKAHPGVAVVYDQGDVYLGGAVSVLNRVKYTDFVEYRKDPAELRKFFHDKGWKRVVGFQTRNPIHRAHEYLQKCALEMVDGLLIHPLVGATKADDVSAEVRMKCYEVLLKNYYPADRTCISVFPAAMRYAGPREAIFHAIVRKNYGCTHFIVGRDHAGVGNYYGTYDAQLIFDEFDPAELAIQPMFFEHTVFCKKCEGMASAKTCPHGKEEHVFLSGTKVRELLSQGIEPPHEFSRPEVARILIQAMKK